ncbi:MAG: DUF4199 domain-containing protein [Bacteroidota bacterium]
MNTLDDSQFTPDPSKVSVIKTGVKYGIMLGLAGVISQLVMLLLGMNDSGADPTTSALLNLLSLAISIAIIVFAVRYHRDRELGGFISFGRGMKLCFWLGLVSGIITAIWTWIYQNLIAPESLDAIKTEIEKIKAQVDDGEVPEMTLTIMEWTYAAVTNPLSIMVGSLLSILFIGLFVSLFTKRNPVVY